MSIVRNLSVAAVAPATIMRRLAIETREPIELIDITDDVIDIVRASGLRDGIVTVFSRHTTASVRLQEGESLLLQDLRRFLRKIAPPADYYKHNDFVIRTEHMHDDESPNGHSHCLQMLMGASETVPVEHGELQLGTWQRLFFVELDGPRPQREVLVHMLGTRVIVGGEAVSIPFESLSAPLFLRAPGAEVADLADAA